ncbi:MAG: DMT family transporter, partial [Candidatus Eremiobacteraeota bacterium]|nr:DMT family transporter [Candidatus Eremiobacteraeota bacterium]
MGILLGLLAATAYGAADFCGGLASRRTSTFAVAIVTQAVGFVLLFALLPFFHGSPTHLDYVWGILAGFCVGIGLALLYQALSTGKMGVVSPITAVVSASIPVLIGPLRGEHLSVWQLWGIAVALV